MEILEEIYGGERLAEIRQQQEDNLISEFEHAYLVDGLWHRDRDGKIFARLGDYPDLEPCN